ncbi:hypothetical protein CK203_088923 [Vitis vinifera]|nr:hypothetical protein CK203_088923 [Vitis vinifera]
MVVHGKAKATFSAVANEVVDVKGRSREGFKEKWRSWIGGFVSTTNFVMLINGRTSGWVG